MDDKDIFIFESNSAADSLTIDLSDSVHLDLDITNYGAAQSVYTIDTIDTITVNGTNWDGISDWLVEREIIEQHREEKHIRETHPAVQHAYEQYQIMLNLAREEMGNDQDQQQS